MSVKRAIYRKWKNEDGQKYCFARIIGSTILIVSYQHKKIRMVDDVRMFFDSRDIISDRKKQPISTKAEFEKAFKLANKKLRYLSTMRIK